MKEIHAGHAEAARRLHLEAVLAKDRAQAVGAQQQQGDGAHIVVRL